MQLIDYDHFMIGKCIQMNLNVFKWYLCIRMYFNVSKRMFNDAKCVDYIQMYLNE